MSNLDMRADKARGRVFGRRASVRNDIRWSTHSQRPQGAAEGATYDR